MLNKTLLGSAAVIMTMVGAQAADLPSKKAAPATYVKICDAYGAGFYTIPGTDTCIKVGGRVRVDYDYRPARERTVGGAVAAVTAVNGVFMNTATGTVVQAASASAAVTALNTADSTSITSSTSTFRTLTGAVAGVTAVDATGTGNTAGTDTTTSGFYNRGVIQVDARTPTSMGVARSYMALRLETGSGPLAKTSTVASLESAFVQWAGFTFGQAAQPAAFMSSWAYNTHYWGGWPNGVRQLTYTAVLGGGFSATVGVTDMQNYNTVATASSISTPSYNQIVYVGNVRYDQSWGAVQVFGAAHTGGNLTGGTASATTETGTKESGYAIGIGASFKLPMLAAGDEIQMTFVYNDRLQNIIGDASLNTPSAGAYGTNPLGGPGVNFANGTGWVAGAQLRHFWTSNFRSQVYASYTSRTQHDTATYTGGSGNAMTLGKAFIYTPAKDFDIGLEFNYLRASWDQAATRTVAGWTGFAGNISESNFTTKLRVERNF